MSPRLSVVAGRHASSTPHYRYACSRPSCTYSARQPCCCWPASMFAGLSKQQHDCSPTYSADTSGRLVKMKRIGIDVGGTNTDAALLCGTAVLATAKAPSTADTLTGIVRSLECLRSQTSNGLQDVQAVMLGTTQFVNAVIEQKHLSKVFVVRLCGTATGALPPFTGMPHHLIQRISAGYLLASGGFEYDGTTETAPLQASTDAAQAAEMMLAAGAAAAAVCGVHSPLNPGQELAFAAELQAALQQRAPSRPVHITLSHKLSGRLGLLERESAAVLNASLVPLAAAVIPQYSAALQQLGLQVPLYITGNDGTLMTAAAAQEHPVLSFKSGPVNSVRGAAFLAGVQDALVCDIGGTTTDVGAVVHGTPRMCGAFVEVAGVCTNFQMPDVTSFGLGGGSQVVWRQQQQQQQEHQPEQLQQQQEQRRGIQQQQHQPQQECSIGPLSVGADLTRSCLVCGGSIATASDVAVLLHDRLPELTSKQAAAAVPAGQLPSKQQLQTAWQAIQSRLAAGVDAAKQSAADVLLVVAGGGAGLCGDTLPGVSCMLGLQHGDVANAVGAAIPQVAGVIDTLLLLHSEATRQQQLDAVVQQAIAAAVEAGAEPGSCEVIELEEVPVAYGSPGATRVHVKVAGELQLKLQVAAVASPELSASAVVVVGAGLDASDAAPAAVQEQPWDQKAPVDRKQTQQQQQQRTSQQLLQQPLQQPAALADPQPPPEVSSLAPHSTSSSSSSHLVPTQQHSLRHLLQYRPCINSQGLWEVSDLDLDAMAMGAQILGTGGGGSARHNRLKLEHAMLAAAAAGTGYQQQQAGNRQSSTSTPSTTGSSRQQKWQAPLIMSLTDLPDDAYVCDVGGMGAPTVSAEKLDSHECAAAVRGLSAALPHPITALLCAEVGGGNALEPLAVGMEQGLPVVDADLMGRAFPELQMSTAAIAGVPLTPAAVADDKGNVLVMATAASPSWAEKVLRAACTEMGCSVGLASSPMTGSTARKVVVPGSLSFAWHIGMAVLRARAAKADPVAAVLGLYKGSGRLLLSGKVVDVQRHTQEGFVRGSIRIAARQPLASAADSLQQQPQQQHLTTSGVRGQASSSDGSSSGDDMVIEFQNESLVAQQGSRVVGCVPDLICCLDSSSGEAIATEEMRYGLWLSVLLLPAHPLLRTPAALQVVGPAAFGYAAEYQPVGRFPTELRTVHELYGGSRQAD